MAVGETVLRRKVAGSKAPEPPPKEEGARAWTIALARAAREQLGLSLSLKPLRDEQVSLGEVLEHIPSHSLLAVIEGEGQALGVIAMCTELTASVIEVQTIGKLSPTPPAPRRPTRTDAAMSAPLLDIGLGYLERALQGCPDHAWASGFRYASFIEEARALGILLEDQTYRLLLSEVDIDQGSRKGRVILALPAEPVRPQAVPDAPAAPLPEAPAAIQAWRQELCQSVLSAEMSFDAQLGRLRLPIGKVQSLAEGMILLLDTARIDDVRLLGPDGQEIAKAKLGQQRGQRAIKLSIPDESAQRQLDQMFTPSVTPSGSVPTPSSSILTATALEVDTAMIHGGVEN